MWTPSVSTGVSGYRVYWGTASRSYGQAAGTGTPVGTVAGYTVTGLPLGATYYFALTTVDAVGNESALSAEATKVVQ
jgi:fibronectin type 3 domain-containing protein